jgi:hypothetical protein
MPKLLGVGGYSVCSTAEVLVRAAQLAGPECAG